jgi:hypothetical protein
VAIQPYNESGLPDFFVLLDDLQPAEASQARYRVTQAVLNLRWQYANPWLLDYYFLNLEQYRADNPNVSWHDFVTTTETIIYVRADQPLDVRISRWAGAAAGMAGCVAVALLLAIANRASASNLLTEGLQAVLFLFPVLLLAGVLASLCTQRSFRRAGLWSNGEAVFNAWTEALVESGVLIGGTLSILATVVFQAGFLPDFLAIDPDALPGVRESYFWQAPPPISAFSYINPTSILAFLVGLVVGLISGFLLAISTGWLVRRWVSNQPLTQTTPRFETRRTYLFKYLSLAVTLAAFFFACYCLWPAGSTFSAN